MLYRYKAFHTNNHSIAEAVGRQHHQNDTLVRKWQTVYRIYIYIRHWGLALYAKIMDRAVRPEKIYKQIADKAVEDNFQCYGGYVVAVLLQFEPQRCFHLFFFL